MMCGGLAAAAGHRSRSAPGLLSPLARWTELLAWQLGRVGSYSLMGAIAGAVGGAFLALAAVDTARHAAMVLANLMLLALGLHLLRVSRLITQLESQLGRLWRFIQPFAVASLTPSGASQAEGQLSTSAMAGRIARAARVGALWGWLPCGLVYSMVLTAAVTGSAWTGLGWMFAFGLGTIPSLFLASWASGMVLSGPRSDRIRQLAGLLIVSFALWGLARSLGLAPPGWLDVLCITP
jgi:uncharacterized protein